MDFAARRPLLSAAATRLVNAVIQAVSAEQPAWPTATVRTARRAAADRHSPVLHLTVSGYQRPQPADGLRRDHGGRLGD
jgi:hypothetical protein